MREKEAAIYDKVAIWARIACFLLPIIVALPFGHKILTLVSAEAAIGIGIVIQLALVVIVPDRTAAWAAKRYGK